MGAFVAEQRPRVEDYDLSTVEGRMRRERDYITGRRNALLRYGGMQQPEADVADTLLRDVSTGRYRRARMGSTGTALGLYEPTGGL